MFLTDIVPDIRKLPGICETKDWPNLASAAHKLKPTLAMVGLSELEEKMRQLENSARQDKDVNLIEEYCHDFMIEIDKVLPILETELQKLSQV